MNYIVIAATILLLLATPAYIMVMSRRLLRKRKSIAGMAQVQSTDVLSADDREIIDGGNPVIATDIATDYEPLTAVSENYEPSEDTKSKELLYKYLNEQLSEADRLGYDKEDTVDDVFDMDFSEYSNVTSIKSAQKKRVA